MARKKRTQHTSHCKNNKDFKPFLRDEFDCRCAYCLVPEGEIGGSKSFQVDHYKPKSIFPSLATTYTNLFYACRDCNAYKAAYWHGLLQKALGKFIINPCDHDPDEHLNRSAELWEGLSSAGKWNITRLRLNSPAQIKRREDRKKLFSLLNFLKQLKNSFIENAKQDNSPPPNPNPLESFKNIDDHIGVLERKLEARLD